MRKYSHKFVNFTLIIAQGSGLFESQAKLKRKLDQLSSQIYQIQTFKQQGNTLHIGNMKTTKIELQTSVVDSQIKL